MINLGPALKRSGMTQVALANAIGVSPGFISELRSGKKNPSTATLERIANALGCSVADILDGAGHLAPAPAAPPGFAESDVMPLTQPMSEAADAADAAPAYVMRHAAPAFALIAGDKLTIDMRRAPRDHDLVIATEADDMGNARTRLFRMITPWLIPTDPAEQAMRRNAKTVILAVVTKIERDLP